MDSENAFLVKNENDHKKPFKTLHMSSSHEDIFHRVLQHFYHRVVFPCRLTFTAKAIKETQCGRHLSKDSQTVNINFCEFLHGKTRASYHVDMSKCVKTVTFTQNKRDVKT